MHLATRGSQLALWQARTTQVILGEEHELLVVNALYPTGGLSGAAPPTIF